MDRRKVTGVELVHRLGLFEIAESMHAEEAPCELRRELGDRGVIGEDLATVGDFHESLAAVCGLPVVAVVDAVRMPGIDPHSERRLRARPRMAPDSVGDPFRTGGGGRRVREHGEEAVPEVAVINTSGLVDHVGAQATKREYHFCSRHGRCPPIERVEPTMSIIRNVSGPAPRPPSTIQAYDAEGSGAELA